MVKIGNKTSAPVKEIVLHLEKIEEHERKFYVQKIIIRKPITIKIAQTTTTVKIRSKANPCAESTGMTTSGKMSA